MLTIADGGAGAPAQVDGVTDRAARVPARGWRFGEYSASDTPEWVLELMRDVEAAGCWHTGIDGDRDGYEAINADVFGWSQRDGLALVQVRQTTRENRRLHQYVRKSYLLVGRNENGSVFGHGVPSPRRSKTAMASPEAAVRWALATHVWLCDVADLDHIVRQGDVALVPIRQIPADAQPVEGGSVTLRESHVVRGDLYRASDNTLYARGIVVLDHTPGEHGHVRTRRGLWRVQVGQREALWDFVGRKPNSD